MRVIEPWKPGVAGRLQEFWAYKHTVGYMGSLYMLRRIRRTYLGWIWIPLRPGLDILSRSIFIGGILGVSSGDRPYFIFLAFSSLGWVLFDQILHWGTRAVRISQGIGGRTYVPRLPALVGSVVPSIVQCFFYSIVAIAAIVFFLVVRGVNYLTPPTHWIEGFAGLFLMLWFGIAVALWTSALSGNAKDVRYLMGYLTQFWYVITPVAYAHAKAFGALVTWNPLTGPIELVKDGFLATGPPTPTSMVVSFVALAVLTVGGLSLFSRFEGAAVARL